MTRNDFELFVPEKESTSHAIIPAVPDVEEQVLAHINALTKLWGDLSKAQTDNIEVDPLRRSTLSRVRHAQETNAIFSNMRQLLQIPDDVRVGDFAQWMNLTMESRKAAFFKEWEESLRRKRIEAPMDESFEPTPFICHAEGE